MGDGAHLPLIDGVHENAALAKARAELGGGAAGPADVEDRDVGLDPRWVDLNSGDARESFGEELRVAMIVKEAFRSLLEGDQAGGREDPDLAHATAEAFAIKAAFGDEGGRSGKDRAGGRSEGFRKAEHQGVGGCGDLADGHSERGGGVEDARAVHVDLEGTV